MSKTSSIKKALRLGRRTEEDENQDLAEAAGKTATALLERKSWWDASYIANSGYVTITATRSDENLKPQVIEFSGTPDEVLLWAQAQGEGLDLEAVRRALDEEQAAKEAPPAPLEWHDPAVVPASRSVAPPTQESKSAGAVPTAPESKASDPCAGCMRGTAHCNGCDHNPRREENMTKIEALQKAVDTRTVLHLTYIDNQGALSERDVLPVRVVHEPENEPAYLLAYCYKASAARTFKVVNILVFKASEKVAPPAAELPAGYVIVAPTKSVVARRPENNYREVTVDQAKRLIETGAWDIIVPEGGKF